MQAATQGAIFAWLCTREGEQIRIFELADYLSFLAVGYPVRLQSARLTHNQQFYYLTWFLPLYIGLLAELETARIL